MTATATTGTTTAVTGVTAGNGATNAIAGTGATATGVKPIGGIGDSHVWSQGREVAGTRERHRSSCQMVARFTPTKNVITAGSPGGHRGM
ncbi:hypothetical protein BLX90_03375 [Rhizobium sp. Y9]|nr:hypothetical protein BLX90_03375 [Rhizobium sp. Y9]OAI90236.1 hypothetical protein AYO27_02080 [Rhizobium sp. GHKF11]